MVLPTTEVVVEGFSGLNLQLRDEAHEFARVMWKAMVAFSVGNNLQIVDGWIKFQ